MMNFTESISRMFPANTSLADRIARLSARLTTEEQVAEKERLDLEVMKSEQAAADAAMLLSGKALKPSAVLADLERQIAARGMAIVAIRNELESLKVEDRKAFVLDCKARAEAIVDEVRSIAVDAYAFAVLARQTGGSPEPTANIRHHYSFQNLVLQPPTIESRVVALEGEMRARGCSAREITDALGCLGFHYIRGGIETSAIIENKSWDESWDRAERRKNKVSSDRSERISFGTIMNMIPLPTVEAIDTRVAVIRKKLGMKG